MGSGTSQYDPILWYDEANIITPSRMEVRPPTSYSYVWIAVDLAASDTYIIQTRLPVPGNHYVSLYTETGSSVGWSTTGDDGYPTQKITYTPPVAGRYIIGFNPYSQGDYPLECLPAPLGGPVVVMGAARLAARREVASGHAARQRAFSLVRQADHSARNCARGAEQSGHVISGGACSLTRTGLPVHLDSFPYYMAAKLPVRFDSPPPPPTVHLPVRLHARSGRLNKNTTDYHARADTRFCHTIMYDALNRSAATHRGQIRSFVNPATEIRACNTSTGEWISLGVIPQDAADQALRDVELPDGDYLLEAVLQGGYWRGVRGRLSTPLRIGEVAGDPIVVGLPPVLDLSRTVILTGSRLSWCIPEGDYSTGTVFGVWTDLTDSIDLTCDPLLTIPVLPGVCNYSANITHAETIFATVAAMRNSELGPAATLQLPWSTTPPHSPGDQGRGAVRV